MSVAKTMIANLYEGGMSVAEMMIADSFGLMWSGPLIEMTCVDTPSFVESYRMSPGPFLVYKVCEASEVDEVENLIDANS